MKNAMNVNAMYSVFVITALKSWKLSLPRQYGQPVNMVKYAKYFWPISDRINGVPL